MTWVLAYAIVAIGYGIRLVVRYRRRSANGMWRAQLTPGDYLGIALIATLWPATLVMWCRKMIYNYPPSWMMSHNDEIRVELIGGTSYGETHYYEPERDTCVEHAEPPRGSSSVTPRER